MIEKRTDGWEDAEQFFTDMCLDHACYVVFDDREDLYEYWCEEVGEGGNLP